MNGGPEHPARRGSAQEIRSAEQTAPFPAGGGAAGPRGDRTAIDRMSGHRMPIDRMPGDRTAGHRSDGHGGASR
ncbi:hypothetical protein [Streptomyces iranensis]|uniref:Uncharacterized protein n=1 Tax=Streptomyces iranensis TaxID=576784 RepID=A0A060ZKG1_9ACTN|nr:hypothetical protein [Streptomyces iranensis]MBP2066355.1 hypothetical protein [Streptomyces iranensis]CDR02852.1 predicted protein [Streptomyces iranensis]